MNAKRYRKLDAIANEYRLFDRFGAQKPEAGVLCWGSSAGVVREAIGPRIRAGEIVKGGTVHAGNAEGRREGFSPGSPPLRVPRVNRPPTTR